MENNTEKNKRTIKSVLDLETGYEVMAIDFFKQSEDKIWAYRRMLEDAIQGVRSPKFVCHYCMQKIKIHGGQKSTEVGKKSKILHFAHYKDSDDCPIKTNAKFSEYELLQFRYNAVKESETHIKSKELIGEFLRENEKKNLGVQDVKIESVHKSITKQWRKPDVSCRYKDMKLVFELQLLTTYLNVIAARENFYKENKEYIIWVFREFDLESDSQKFNQKDIYYSNNKNAFVLDEIAIEKSKNSNDLYLLCYYEQPFIDNEGIEYLWEEKYVTLADLKFDEKNFKVYFYDVETEQKNLEIEILNRYERKQKEAKENNFIEELGLTQK